MRDTLKTPALRWSWNNQRLRSRNSTDLAHQTQMSSLLLQATRIKMKLRTRKTAIIMKSRIVPQQQSPATHRRLAFPLVSPHGTLTRIPDLVEGVVELLQTEQKSRPENKGLRRIQECKDHPLLYELPQIHTRQLENLLNSPTQYLCAQDLPPTCELHGEIRTPSIELKRKPTYSGFGMIAQIG